MSTYSPNALSWTVKPFPAKGRADTAHDCDGDSVLAALVLSDAALARLSEQISSEAVSDATLARLNEQISSEAVTVGLINSSGVPKRPTFTVPSVDAVNKHFFKPEEGTVKKIEWAISQVDVQNLGYFDDLFSEKTIVWENISASANARREETLAEMAFAECYQKFIDLQTILENAASDTPCNPLSAIDDYNGDEILPVLSLAHIFDTACHSISNFFHVPLRTVHFRLWHLAKTSLPADAIWQCAKSRFYHFRRKAVSPRPRWIETEFLRKMTELVNRADAPTSPFSDPPRTLLFGSDLLDFVRKYLAFETDDEVIAWITTLEGIIDRSSTTISQCVDEERRKIAVENAKSQLITFLELSCDPTEQYNICRWIRLSGAAYRHWEP